VSAVRLCKIDIKRDHRGTGFAQIRRQTAHNTARPRPFSDLGEAVVDDAPTEASKGASGDETSVKCGVDSHRD
jgi:hypothetical protein